MDSKTLSLLSKLAPDLMDEIGRRAVIIERISMLQPVGRRALAHRLTMPEREIRAISETLKNAGFLNIDAAGMTLRPEADEILEGARDMVRALRGIAYIESQLARLLSIGRVIVVPGNADEDTTVLHEVGRAMATKLRMFLKDGAILAVTGGSTIAEVASNVPHGMPIDIQVLPARGGMGRKIETQAGTLAAELARKLGGHHRLLHLPDTLNPDALREMMKIPEIKECLELLKKTDVLLYGIGRADDMAQYRRLTPLDLEILESKGAISEALGYYFNASGRIVQSASSVGIDIENISSIGTIIAVVAGSRKAEAILSVLRHHRHDLLVTDEGAAKTMLSLIKQSA